MADEPTIEEVAERRIEELVRERDEAWRASDRLRAERIADPLWKNRATAAEALVTTLKAEVEEWRLAYKAIYDKQDLTESRLASLTGQVEDARTSFSLIQRHAAPRAERTFDQLIRDVGYIDDIARAAIRSLPVLPTTGDGGEDDADLPDISEVRGILKPTGRETSGEET